MDKVKSVVSDIANPKAGGGDSFVDRLNFRFTVYLLFFFCFVITTKQYVEDPINCWCPAHFTDSQVDFTNSVCWTTGTYYLPSHHARIPRVGERKSMVGYYQWVPLILVLMAVLFYIPRVCWVFLSKFSGVAVNTITNAAVQYQEMWGSSERDKYMTYIAHNLERGLTKSILSTRSHGHRRVRKACFKTHGNYLIVAYILIKCVYLLNVAGQVYLLDKFLGIDYHGYGFHIIERIANGDDWGTSDRFPRVALCNMWIRVLGHAQRYTVQCALPMNLVNEIVFIFIWFWLMFVFFATLCSLVKWTIIGIYRDRQVKYAIARLSAMTMLDKKGGKGLEVDKVKVRDFVHKFLGRDGFLMIRLVSHNTTDMIASELLYRLWSHYVLNRTTIDGVYEKSKLADGFNNISDDPELGNRYSPSAPHQERVTQDTGVNKRPPGRTDVNGTAAIMGAAVETYTASAPLLKGQGTAIDNGDE